MGEEFDEQARREKNSGVRRSSTSVGSRQAVERELRETQERYQALMHTISDLFWETDCQGRYTYCSPQMERLLGMSPAQMIGRTPFDVMPAEERDAALQSFAELVRSPRPFSGLDVVSYDGRGGLLELEISGVPFFDDAGQLRGFRGVTRDITDRKRAEAALRASEARFRLIASSTPDHLLVQSRELRYEIVVNPQLGLTESDMVGKTDHEILPEKDADHVVRIKRRVMETGQPERLEIPLTNRKGETEIFEGSYVPRLGDSGEVDGIIGYFRNVTDRRRADAQLARHNAVLAGSARIFQHALICETEDELRAVCLAVAEEVTHSKFGFIGELNPKTGKLDGIAISNSGWEACSMEEGSDHPPAAPVAFPIQGLQSSLLADGKGFLTNDPSAHPDSEQMPDGLRRLMTSYLGVPLIQGSKIIGMLGLGNRDGGYGPEDLEAAERLASAIVQGFVSKRAEQALREADRRKNEFLAILSHELRNPLAPISNSLYVLDRVPPGGQQAARARRVIGRQVEHLASLVNDLLDITRITRNKIQLNRDSMDLGEAVRRAVEDSRCMFEQAEVRLKTEVAPGPVPVRADPTRIAQIIGNLLQNSVKFSRKGGRVRVSVTADGADALLSVADDGIGMTDETLARLFEPFMQADASLDRSQGGLGLGLALVKGLVELHGGRVAAHSDGLGKGTEVVVRLPLELGAGQQAVISSNPPRLRRRVLVIEDNIDAADSLSAALQLDEHVVAVAYNGREGLAKAREFKPDVVLCDIGLPDVDGYQVARAFRADGGLKDTVLVALTGYALPDDIQRAAEAGFEHHLAKPPNMEDLAALLAGLSCPVR
jgi:PAS domain S-box-containing protein